jgi:hypothetical protein
VSLGTAMVLKKFVLGWLLIAATVLYAAAFSTVHAGRHAVEMLGWLSGGSSFSASKG